MVPLPSKYKPAGKGQISHSVHINSRVFPPARLASGLSRLTLEQIADLLRLTLRHLKFKQELILKESWIKPINN